MVKVILGSLGAFPIFDNLVSCKWLVVERNGVKFGPQGWVFSIYRILVKLNASGNSGVIRCISHFQNLVSQKRQILEWKIHLDLCVIQFYVVIVFHVVKQSASPCSWASSLSLFDYVGRAHGMGLCPSSVSQLSQNPLSRFISNFSCGFPWAIPPDFVYIFWKKNAFSNFSGRFFVFVLTMLTWDPMGAKTSNRYSSFKSLLNLLKLFLNFLLCCPHKSTALDFWNFEFLSFHDFFFASTWDPMVSKTWKRYSSHKSLSIFSKVFLNFLLSSPDKSTFLIF